MYEWKQVWFKLRISFIRSFLSIPIIRSFLNGYKECANHFWNLQVQAEDRFWNNLPLILRDYCYKKTCIFQVRTHKVPIEEMTDRWETENSGGCQSTISFTIRFCFRGKNPSLKEIRTSNFRSACWPADYTAGTHASYTALLPISLTNRYIVCLCYGNSTTYKPRIETSGLCSSEHSKVCFQPLEIKWAASNLMFEGTWQGMFWVTQNISGYSRKPCRIPRTYPFEVGIIECFTIK